MGKYKYNKYMNIFVQCHKLKGESRGAGAILWLHDVTANGHGVTLTKPRDRHARLAGNIHLSAAQN